MPFVITTNRYLQKLQIVNSDNLQNQHFQGISPETGCFEDLETTVAIFAATGLTELVISNSAGVNIKKLLTILAQQNDLNLKRVILEGADIKIDIMPKLLKLLSKLPTCELQLISLEVTVLLSCLRFFLIENRNIHVNKLYVIYTARWLPNAQQLLLTLFKLLQQTQQSLVDELIIALSDDVINTAHAEIKQLFSEEKTTKPQLCLNNIDTKKITKQLLKGYILTRCDGEMYLTYDTKNSNNQQLFATLYDAFMHIYYEAIENLFDSLFLEGLVINDDAIGVIGGPEGHVPFPVTFLNCEFKCTTPMPSFANITFSIMDIRIPTNPQMKQLLANSQKITFDWCDNMDQECFERQYYHPQAEITFKFVNEAFSSYSKLIHSFMLDCNKNNLIKVIAQMAEDDTLDDPEDISLRVLLLPQIHEKISQLSPKTTPDELCHLLRMCVRLDLAQKETNQPVYKYKVLQKYLELQFAQYTTPFSLDTLKKIIQFSWKFDKYINKEFIPESLQLAGYDRANWQHFGYTEALKSLSLHIQQIDPKVIQLDQLHHTLTFINRLPLNLLDGGTCKGHISRLLNSLVLALPSQLYDHHKLINTWENEAEKQQKLLESQYKIKNKIFLECISTQNILQTNFDEIQDKYIHFLIEYTNTHLDELLETLEEFYMIAEVNLTTLLRIKLTQLRSPEIINLLTATITDKINCAPDRYEYYAYITDSEGIIFWKTANKVCALWSTLREFQHYVSDKLEERQTQQPAIKRRRIGEPNHFATFQAARPKINADEDVSYMWWRHPLVQSMIQY